jgi:hypothetical protein
MDHLNIFHPYKDLALHHENSLTRAFLIVLRSVPSAHAAWLDLVDRGHRKSNGSGVPSLHELSQAQVATQVGALPERVSRIISVLQTDEHYFAKADVGSSDRTQVLDGVVSYAPELAIVIENKPLKADVWEGQLSINLGRFAADSDVQIDSKPSCVQWHELVGAWSRLLTAGHLGPAEASFVEDFLTYVETHFEHLQPYSTIGACGSSKSRLLRRCRNILTELAAEHVADHRSWGPCLEFTDTQAPAVIIGFFPRGAPVTSLTIDVALADTQGQAQELFSKYDYAAIEALQKAGWSAESNFHCAFMQQNLFYPRPVRDLAAYWAHWAAHLDDLRQRKREEFATFFDELVSLDIASAAERAGFESLFAETNRKKLNVCPGISLRYEIPLDRAVELDNRRALAPLVATEMRRVADSFGMPLAERVGRRK